MGVGRIRYGRSPRASDLARAFSLAELLVVIGIVTLLVAILFPVRVKARRSAVILASAVAYVDGASGVAITFPSGGSSVFVAPSGTLCWCNRPQGPMWSTGGTYLAHTTHVGEVSIVHSMSGRVIRHPLGDQFYGWADDSHFILAQWYTSGGTLFRVYDAESGILRRTMFSQDVNIHGATLAPAAPSSGAAYVTCSSDHNGQSIVLLKNNFGRGKTIWRETRTPRLPYPEPRMDLFGEYVAWTVKPEGGLGYAVALKAVRDPVDRPPNIIQVPGARSVVFLDWTEQGELLVAVLGARGFLHTVLDRNGNLVRELSLDPLARAAVPGAGSWRKYWHR